MATRGQGKPRTVRGAAGEEPADVAAAHRRLAVRARVSRGEFSGLLDREVTRIIEQAARECDLEHEVGALRFALNRLLAEEEDPAKLAAPLARLATAIAQVMKTKRTISGETANSLLSALTQILTELDGE